MTSRRPETTTPPTRLYVVPRDRDLSGAIDRLLEQIDQAEQAGAEWTTEYLRDRLAVLEALIVPRMVRL
jgi:hypothetical protein